MKAPRKSILASVLLLTLLSIGWERRGDSAVRFGKIYLFDETLYVNELTRGVRQLDISNSSDPTSLGLIGIEGNHDTAIRGTPDGRRILYADSHEDLVVFDVTDPASPQQLDNIKNIFEQSYAMRWGEEILLGQPFMPSTDVVGGMRGCDGCSESMIVEGPVPTGGPEIYANSRDTQGGATAGRGGSMARFTIVEDYLYCVDYNQLYVLEISDPARPRFINRVHVGWGIETIFPFGGYLFIGSETGMFIYSLGDGSDPQFLSNYSHLRACDPVVVEGSIAYVTLRGGTRCGTAMSSLHLINIEDLFNPKLLVSYPLPQPMGLDIRNKVAYVCDDSAGVIILDTADPDDIHVLANIGGKPGYDAMLNGDVLIVVNESAVSFYTVANPTMPVLLGRYHVPA